MGRYDSHKHPFHYTMNQWSQKRTNTRQEQQAKSIPCHVTKVDKDFIYVAFETQNNIFTPPTVKIPQSWSQYSREPTQKGDKGYAVPSDYYLGGVTGDAGGSTNYYPRGNLTTLSFNGVSHKQNPDRDYDQLTHMGGPNGWIVGAHKDQKQDQQDQQNQQVAQNQAVLGVNRTRSFAAAQAGLRQQLGLSTVAALSNGSNGSSNGSNGQQQNNQKDDNKTQFSFDKNNKAMVQSKDDKHVMTVDSENGTVSMDSSKLIYHDPTSSGKVILGTKKGGSRVMTEDGPSKNVYALV